MLTTIDTSECRINNQADANAIGRGEADLVTFSPNQDFKCVAHNNILTITPNNGTSFVTSVPTPPQLGPVPGGIFDHIKFLAYSAINTLPEDGSILRTTWVANGKQLNVENNPYGSSVVNPREDIRLASVGLNSIDVSTLLVFDFFISDKIAYALIERLPGLESTFGPYAAFSWAYPILKSKCLYKQYHKYSMAANRAKGTMTWFVDDEPVLKYTQFGFYPSENNVYVPSKCGKPSAIHNPSNYFLVNNHSGAEPREPIELIRLQSGVGLFTLVDWYQPNNVKGLPNIPPVRLESSRYRAGTNDTVFFYNDPITGGESTFLYNSVLAPDGLSYLPTIPTDKRIFGQGAVLNLKELKITIEKL